MQADFETLCSNISICIVIKNIPLLIFVGLVALLVIVPQPLGNLNSGVSSPTKSCINTDPVLIKFPPKLSQPCFPRANGSHTGPPGDSVGPGGSPSVGNKVL